MSISASPMKSSVENVSLSYTSCHNVNESVSRKFYKEEIEEHLKLHNFQIMDRYLFQMEEWCQVSINKYFMQ